MKKFFAILGILVSSLFIVAYILCPECVMPFFKRFGGLQIGDVGFLTAPIFGWALWELSRSNFIAKEGSSACLLVIDSGGRGNVEEAVLGWARDYKEVKDLECLTFLSEKDSNGQVDLEKVYSQIAAWIQKKIVGRFQYVYLVVAGPVGSGIVVGLQLANMTDGMLIEYQGGYKPTATFSKKSIAPPSKLTPIIESQADEK